MTDVICKIVRALIVAQKMGSIATFEMDTAGDISVFIDGRQLDSSDYHPLDIYAQIMDVISTMDIEKEQNK